MAADPRRDLAPLVEALESRGCRVKGRAACCPWHDDTTPSASLLQGNDGIWRVFCHPCSRRAHVLDLRAEDEGKNVADLLRALPREDRPMPTRPAVESERKALILADKSAVVTYCERVGQVQSWHRYGPKDMPALVVARIVQASGKKTFRQFSPSGGGWAAAVTAAHGTLPLYRQHELASAETVLVVEGERKCDAAWDIGIPATTSSCGAGKADRHDWRALTGKTCIIWPDHDEPGRKHAEQVAGILDGLGCRVSVVEPADLDLSEGEDIADLLERLDAQTADQQATIVRDIMASAVPRDPAAALTSWAEDCIAGRWQALDWPLPRIGRLSRMCLPGTVGLLCADPGAGKSWLVLQLAAFWRASGIRIAVRMLEDEARSHLARLLAHLDGCSDLTDDAWLRSNPARTREALARHREALADAARWITAEDDAPPSLPDLCAWVERQAKAGARVVIVDPITAAAPEREPWVADFTAAMRLKRCARETGCSIVVTTHPRGASKGASLSAMAGGSAWPRFCHSAMWLERIDPSERRLNGGGIDICNRIVRITKCRHGRGAGLSVGLVWDENCAAFREVGVLAPDDVGMSKRGVPVAPRVSRAARLHSGPSPSEDAFASGEAGP